MLGVLIFRLAVLTIVEGEDYRRETDIKLIRDIPIKAPRGNIYDRNGVLLAGNIPSFTVQIRKDEIQRHELKETIFMLADILDRNNERVIDEFPIILNHLSFTSEEAQEMYFFIEEYVEALIIDNQLVGDILKMQDTHQSGMSVRERLLFIINQEISTGVEYENGQFTITDDSLEPYEVLEELIYENTYLVKKWLSNSELRYHIYKVVQKIDTENTIQLTPFSFTYDNDYNRIKLDLIDRFDEINEQTSAKHDFMVLVRHYLSDDFYRMVFTSDGADVKPGKFLLEAVQEKFPDFPVSYILDENIRRVYFNYTDSVKAEEFLRDHDMPSDLSAYFVMIEIANRYDLDFKIIERDDIKFFAQGRLLSHINPQISVSAWEYSAIIRKNNWIRSNLGVDFDDSFTAQMIFNDLKIREGLEESSDYIARKYFVVKERYIKQGYLAFHPIEMSYGVSEKTVALIAENSDKLKGVEVVVQPLRVYPYGESAAHILGYLGKISQDFEINEYIRNNGYSQDDLIGKTGVEESFELFLSGIKGRETLKVDAQGRRIGTSQALDPEPGNNLYLTIDIELQRKAEQMMAHALEQVRVGGVYESKWGDYNFDRVYPNAYSGALVAIDVTTGELITMVNHPSYDPNLFTTGISQEDWISLMNESRDFLAPRPLYNISMLTAIQPGSTFKILTSIAALEKGISPNERIYCSGVMEIGNQSFGCWIWNMFRSRHGYENMYEAIRDSCNFYFYSLVLGENRVTGERTSIKLELEDILDMARQFGLNDKTGIEIRIPNEASGGMPNPDTKINSIKFFLRRYLNENIEHFYLPGFNFNDDEKEQLVNEIVSWVSGTEPLSRGEVYTRLRQMDLNPDKLDSHDIPFVDMVKYSFLNQAVWNDGDNLNISIGQGDNAYTPLQMANFTATVANGGYLRNVSVILEGRTYDNRRVVHRPLRQAIKVQLTNDRYLDEVTKGMVMVSKDSRVYNNLPIQVASKTGTAERDGLNPETGQPYDDFAWYIAFAPADNPQIAVAAVFFQGGSGRFPAPLVRDVIAEYLGLEPEIEDEE